MLDDIKKDADGAHGEVRRRAQERTEEAAHRPGAAPACSNTCTVEYYGTEVPLTQVANIAVEDSRTLTVVAVGEEHGARRSRRRS